jgi:hypothetical protein
MDTSHFSLKSNDFNKNSRFYPGSKYGNTIPYKLLLDTHLKIVQIKSLVQRDYFKE